MTKKQMRKIAQEIVDLNQKHENPETSEEEKVEAEKRIYAISRQILCLPRGMETLEQIDEITQKILKEKQGDD